MQIVLDYKQIQCYTFSVVEKNFLDYIFPFAALGLCALARRGAVQCRMCRAERRVQGMFGRNGQRWRRWTYLVYPEEAGKDFKEKLFSLVDRKVCRRVAVSSAHVHERKNLIGRKHYHVLVVFDKPVSLAQADRVAASTYGDSGALNFCYSEHGWMNFYRRLGGVKSYGK